MLRSANRGRVMAALVASSLLLAALFAIRDVATPVLSALALAYILLPVVDALERRLKLPRPLGAIGLMLGVTLIAAGLVALVVPTLIAQSSALAARLPAYLTQAIAWIEITFHLAIPTDASHVIADVRTYIAELEPGALGKLGGYVARVLAESIGAIRGLVSLLLVPLFTFFFLKDWKNLTQAVMTLLPAPMQGPIAAKLGQIDHTLSAYVRGVLTVATILAVLYSIALSVLGVPLGLLIGVLAGLAYVVPFMSGVVGIGLGVLFSVLEFSGFSQILGVVIVFAVGNLIESFILTPRIVGGSLGLPPVAVILAVVIGGDLFGLLGVLLALPSAAVLHVVGRDLLAAWRASAYYQTGLAGLETKER